MARRAQPDRPRPAPLLAAAAAGALPDHPSRPALVLLLEPALSQHARALAAVPQPALLGRGRHHQLPRRRACLLVHRPAARSRDAARPGHRAHAAPDRRAGRCGRSSTASRRSAGAARRHHWHRWSRPIAIAALFGLRAGRVAADRRGRDVRRHRSSPAGTTRCCRSPSCAPRSSPGVAFMAPRAVVLRGVFGLDGARSPRGHLDVLARLLLGLGLVNLYCYAAEFFATLLGGDSFDTRRAGAGASRAACLGALDRRWSARCCRCMCSGSPAARRSPWCCCSSACWSRPGSTPTISWSSWSRCSTISCRRRPSAYRVDLWGVLTFAGLGRAVLQPGAAGAALPAAGLARRQPARSRAADREAARWRLRRAAADEAPLYARQRRVRARRGAARRRARASQPHDLGRIETYSPVPIAGLERALGCGGSLDAGLRARRRRPRLRRHDGPVHLRDRLRLRVRHRRPAAGQLAGLRGAEPVLRHAGWARSWPISACCSPTGCRASTIRPSTSRASRGPPGPLSSSTIEAGRSDRSTSRRGRAGAAALCRSRPLAVAEVPR